jgi:histidinol dehydrogenase
VSNKIDDILISYKQPDFKKRLQSFLNNISVDASVRSEVYREQVTKIVDSVQDQGDKAIAEYTQRYDDVTLSPSDFLTSQAELEKAHNQVDEDILLSIRRSIENVRKYQKEIFVGNSNHPGIRYTPIRRIGICVPGASAPLPSTVIMLRLCRHRDTTTVSIL